MNIPYTRQSEFLFPLVDKKDYENKLGNILLQRYLSNLTILNMVSPTNSYATCITCCLILNKVSVTFLCCKLDEIMFGKLYMIL
jgi:hypothetical protein